MENASKALIIAGAIIVSLLIIGLGVAIYQRASKTVSDADLNSQAAMAQNGQFETYFGDRKSSQECISLVNTVIANNAAASTAGETKEIGIMFDSVLYTTGGEKDLSNLTSGTFKKGISYVIKSHNTKAYAGETADFSSKNDDSGYYKNGYIRIIEITTIGSTKLENKVN